MHGPIRSIASRAATRAPNMARGKLRTRARLAAAFAMGALVATAAVGAAREASTAPAAASASAVPTALDRFCGDAQQLIAKTQLPVENLIMPTMEEFALSKATVRPLSTRQYHMYADDARTLLVQISCKMKTADHIVAEYGAGTAGAEGLCAEINQRTLDAVVGGFTPTERRRLKYGAGRDVVLDPEQVSTNGPEWLAPYPLAWQDAEGRLHILAKAQRNDWLDARYFGADPKFRGTRYCHLIAPDYLRRILLGEVQVGTTPPPPLATPRN